MPWSRSIGRSALAIALGATMAVAAADAPAPGVSGDWPGLWGPGRNAQVAGPLRLEPGMELKEVWRRPIGKGFSQVAVVEGRGYTMDSDGSQDWLSAFDVASGKDLWRSALGATHRGHDGSDDGPLSTPVVAGGRVFALSPTGKLGAFDTRTGREIWAHDLPASLAATPPFYGFATSPLPVGETLLVQVGGAERNNLMAFDQATGKSLWSSQPASDNGYSSPVLMTLGGVQQAVAMTAEKVFGVKPEDGTVLWSHNAVGEPRQSPLALPDDRILLLSWQETAMLKVSLAEGAWKVEELWRKPVLKSTFSPAVYRDGLLYGMNGNYLTVLDPQTAEVRWREKLYGATLILVGDHLAALGERTGKFHLVAAAPDGFREELAVQVFNPGARSLTGPVFVQGRFLLRNTEEMVLLELAKRDAVEPGQGGGR